MHPNVRFTFDSANNLAASFWHFNKYRKLRALLPVLTLVALSGCAAQYPARSFLELQERLKHGNTIYVIDADGTETRGKFVEASETALTLDVAGLRRQIERASVRQVDRYGDSIWNGFLIGSGLGASNALLTDPAPGKDVNAGARVLSVGVMGAIGAGIDALISHRKIIYLEPAGQKRSPSSPLNRP